MLKILTYIFTADNNTLTTGYVIGTFILVDTPITSPLGFNTLHTSGMS